MARSTHVIAFKAMMNGLRTDTDLTILQKRELIGEARGVMQSIQRDIDHFTRNTTAQDLAQKFEDHINGLQERSDV